MSTDQPMPGSEEPPEEPLWGKPDVPGPPTDMPPLAARWRRLLARIIDYVLIIGIPSNLIVWIYGRIHPALGLMGSALLGVIFWLVYIGYDGYLLTTRGRTFGKQWMKIQVGMLHDGSLPAGRPGWLRAAAYGLPGVLAEAGWALWAINVLPAFVPSLFGILWLINVLWLLWDKPYQQALHDKAAETVVVSAQ
ncbi:RDD family protein [Streptomyces sp. NPDC058424]|uniref:RDD family protein n=1 Tax=Streptomyces sp. NPDC058424 TaxID=3346491 RepID=UPI00365B1A48